MKNQAAARQDFNSERERVIRQNRLDLVGDNCLLNINEKSYEVVDCSPFGIAFKSDVQFEKNATHSDLKITFNNIKINEVSIRVIRSDMQDSFYKTACEVIGQPIEIEKIMGIKSAAQVINLHREESSKYLAVPEDFRRIVYEMKVWLLSLRDKVNKLSESNGFNRASEAGYFESTIANIVGNYIVDTFEPQYVVLQGKLSKTSEDIKNASFEFFREQMIEILLSAPFHNRAYTKPLGYAGDYQMMNQIYSYESIGHDLFSKCLHLYFISAPESRAVRNRAKYLQDQISKVVKKDKSKTVNILSVASGPAFEVQNFIRDNKGQVDNINFYLLDQDLEALQHAQRKIKSIERDIGVKINISLINKPIKHVIARGLEGKFDLIYSAGLFDYFTDPVAQMAGLRLFEALNPGGKLIIGNFSSDSMGQLTMDIALDWHLIYRSQEDLTKLFSGIGAKFHIESEEEGINLFCHLDK